MADGYDDLFELGFEGLDKFTNKYHDQVFNLAGRRHSSTETKKGSKHRSAPTGRRDSAQEQQRDIGRAQRRASSPTPTTMYTQDRRREGERDVYSSVREDDTRYYAAPAGSVVSTRGRDPYEYPGGYQLAPRMPTPPEAEYESRRYDAVYEERRDLDRRRPLPPHRRGSSYSPPRRHEHEHDRDRDRGHDHSPTRRQRSKSPNHHRVAATVVGAIAGGLISNRVSKGSTITTVAGAVVGGLGGRQAEKMYDHHKHREFEEEERWERRQRERDQRGHYN